MNRQWPAAASRRGARLRGAGAGPAAASPGRRAAGSAQADPDRRAGQGVGGDYVLPFEAISVFLLVALVGSIIIARER